MGVMDRYPAKKANPRPKLNPKQFTPDQVGPELATRLSKGYDPPDTTTGRLFDTASVPMAEPHQQTQEQFAGDARTWWHGRYQHPDMQTMHYNRETQGKPGVGGGIHVGSKQSALDRVTALGRPKTRPHPHSGEDEAQWVSRGFPVRPAAPTVNTPDRPINDQWDDWYQLPDERGEYYRNQVEDQGNLSMRFPGPHSVMNHRQFVEQAVKQGKDVHPVIAAEAQRNPDYTESAFSEYEKEDAHVGHWARKSYSNPHLFEPNSIQWPGSGDDRRKQLVDEHKDDMLKRKDPGLHGALQEFGKVLG